MASTKGITLDKVMIEIESDSSNADKNIESLSETLGKLKNNTKGGFASISRLAEHINNLKKSTDNLGNIENKLASVNGVIETLNKLSEIKSPKSIGYLNRSLTELNESSSYIDNISKNFQNIEPLVSSFQSLSSIETASGLGYAIKQLGELSNVSGNIENLVEKSQKLSELVEPLQSLSNIKTPRALGYIVNNIENLERVLASITPTTLENVTRVSNELTRALDPLAEKMARIGQGYSALSQLARTYGVQISNLKNKYSSLNKDMSVSQRLINGIRTGFTKSTSAITQLGKNGTKQFESLNSKIKQVYLSLLGTRTLFTAVRKAISEYSQMDAELTKQTTNLWRALGAQLAPALELALYLFKQFTRVIYSFVYAVTGIDLIARANAKAMASWGSSAKDTLGALQKFDDLNVAEFGSGDSDNSLIELDKIDLSPIQKVIDWVKKLKEAIKDAWKTGKWTAVAEVIGEGFEYAIDNFPSDRLANIISNTITTGFKVINTLINKIPWKTLGKKIRETILNIKWDDILQELGTTIGSVISAGISFTAGLTGIDIDTSTFDFVNSLNSISEGLDWTNLLDSLTRLGEAMLPLGANVGNGLIKLYNEFLVPVAEYVVNDLVPTFLDTLSSVFDTLNTVIEIIKPNIEWLWDNVLNPLLEITEMVLIGLLQDLTEKFKAFSDWCVENKQIVQLVTDMIVSFLGSLFLYLSVKGIATLVETLAYALMLFAEGLATVNIPLVLTVVGFGALVYGILEIYKNWDKMNNLEKVTVVLSALAIAATTAAIAVGAFQSAWTLGIAAAAIVAGIVAITASVNEATKRAETDLSDYMTSSIAGSGGGGSRGYATGGFPEKGQYFYARENGIPEYVGSIGSRTAVANNNQIIDGIKMGVKEALNESNFDTTTIVNIGNKTLYKQQEKYNRKQNDKYGTTVNI